MNNLLQSVTPIIKEPLQQTLNYDFFREKKIKEWENQTAEYMGFKVPVRLRHAAMNISWLNLVSRATWKDRPGRPAPTQAQHWAYFLTGLNLKPLQTEKLRSQYEHKQKMHVKELVSNFRRTGRFEDVENQRAILRQLIDIGYDATGLIDREIKKSKSSEERDRLVGYKQEFQLF